MMSRRFESWKEAALVGVINGSLQGGEWRQVGKRGKAVSTRKSTALIDLKSFVFERNTLGKVESLICVERKRNFYASCEIDLVGAIWFALLLRREAGQLFKDQEQWSTRTAVGNLSGTRSRNRHGEFIKLSWTQGSKTSRPLFFPSGLAKAGWHSIADAILEVIPDHEARLRVADEDMAAQKPHRIADLRATIDERKFGKWICALVVEVDTIAISWQSVGRWIGSRFKIARDFELSPFSTRKAIFFADSEANLVDCCNRGSWSEEGVAISLRRWTPDINGVEDETPSEWFFLEGIPFHLWSQEDIALILNGRGRVKEIAEISLRMIDLSGVRVLLQGWNGGPRSCFNFTLKDVSFVVRASICDKPLELHETEFSKVRIPVVSLSSSEKMIGEKSGISFDHVLTGLNGIDRGGDTSTVVGGESGHVSSAPILVNRGKPNMCLALARAKYGREILRSGVSSSKLILNENCGDLSMDQFEKGGTSNENCGDLSMDQFKKGGPSNVGVSSHPIICLSTLNDSKTLHLAKDNDEVCLAGSLDVHVGEGDSQTLLASVPDLAGVDNTFDILPGKKIQIQFKAATKDMGCLNVIKAGEVSAAESSQGLYVKIRNTKKSPPLLGPCKCHFLGWTLRPRLTPAH